MELGWSHLESWSDNTARLSGYFRITCSTHIRGKGISLRYKGKNHLGAKILAHLYRYKLRPCNYDHCSYYVLVLTHTSRTEHGSERPPSEANSESFETISRLDQFDNCPSKTVVAVSLFGLLPFHAHTQSWGLILHHPLEMFNRIH